MYRNATAVNKFQSGAATTFSLARCVADSHVNYGHTGSGQNVEDLILSSTLERVEVTRSIHGELWVGGNDCE
jgi:hypothetical protein